MKIRPYKANRTTKCSDFAPEIVEGYNRIYIGNLPCDVTEEELKKLFSDCKISSIRFGMYKETGQLRGSSTVSLLDINLMSKSKSINFLIQKINPEP